MSNWLKPSSLPGSDPKTHLDACCDEFAGTVLLASGEKRESECPKCGARLSLTGVPGGGCYAEKIDPEPPAFILSEFRADSVEET